MVPLGALVTIVALFVAGVFVIDAGRDDVVADGVRIGTLDVGGMERDEARTLVQSRLAGAAGKPVTVTYGDRRFVLDADDARARVDADATVEEALRLSRKGSAFGRVLGGDDASGTVSPRIAFSRPAVEAFAERVARRIDRRARDADIEWRDGRLDRTRARNGVRTRRAELVALLAERIARPTAERTLKVPVTVTERPDRNLDDLAKRYPTVIAVDRDSRQLRLYKHLQLEHRYRIAVGKAGVETAAGRYKIVEKVVDPPWHAPDKEWAGELAGMTIPPGDPRNPLEARWMGFHDGQGIHGTDDVESLGSAASHGCIRMSVDDVKELFRQVEVGTPIFLQ